MLTKRKHRHIPAALIMLLLSMAPCSGLAKITGEYFWNEDPGIGRANSVELSNASDGLISFDITEDNIPKGLNMLGFRAFTNGRWTQSICYFVMNQASAKESDLHVEYFWDTDPGTGKAIPLASDLVQDGNLIVFDALTDGLTPGVHTFGIRTFSGQAWSQTVNSTVVISDPHHYAIIGAEYFWGEDPGLGNGIQIELSPGDELSVDDLVIDFPSEKADEYNLSLRACSERGWGTTYTRTLPYIYIDHIGLKSEREWIEPNETITITPDIDPADAFTDKLHWSSNNTDVATVDDNGRVTAVNVGSVVITATATDGSDVTGSIALTVKKAVKALKLSTDKLLLRVGQEATLHAILTPTDATVQDVIWTVSEGSGCVTVDDKGIVTAISTGTATIQATAADDSNAADTCIVTVTDTTSGISLSEINGATINVSDGYVIVNGVTSGEWVSITKLNGSIIAHKQSDGSQLKLNTSGERIVIVNIGRSSLKLMLR